MRPVMLFAVLLLAGCAGAPPPSAEQRNATDLNPSGKQYDGPPGIRSSFPPGDPNISNPLVCHLEGQGSVCSRSGTD